MDTGPTGTQKRVQLACEACRKRKRKCDGGKPKCSSCVNQNKECLYEPLPNASLKRKRTLDYVISLEDQLDALKAYVRDLESSNSEPTSLRPPFLDDAFGIDEGPESGPNSQLDARNTPSHAYEQNYRLPSAVDELGSMMWKMSINDSGGTSFIGPSGSFSFSTSASPVTKRAENQKLVSENTVDADHLLMSYLADSNLRKELFQLFSEFINPFHQFVEPSILNFYEYDSSSGPVTTLVQYSILAAGSRLSKRQDADQIGDCFALHAESLALKCCRDHPSLIVIQVLTIMCWRELSLENENMAWMYNSMAASLCIHLGLHVSALENLRSEDESSKAVSSNITEARVRTFWQFFLVDRMITSFLGRQCAIPWKRVKALPFDSILNKSSSLAEVVFDHQCRLWLLHDRFMDQIYSFEFPTFTFVEKNKLLMDARERVVTFHQEIDDRLRVGRDLDSGYVACFQMSYQMSLILIHRPYLREPSDSASYRLALRSMTTAATTMVSLIRAYQKLDGFARAPFYIVHNILTAAIMHLLSSTSSETTLRQQSITQFRVCVTALEHLQHTWPRAQKSISLLQELANRWNVVFALPMRLSNVLPVTFSVADSRKMAQGEALPAMPINNDFETAQMMEHHQAENYNGVLVLGPLEEMGFPEDRNYNDIWMDPSTFNDFAIPDDPFENIGLDWLFAHHP